MTLLPLLAAPALAGAALGEEPSHNYDLLRVVWRLSFDEEKRTIRGDATNVLTAVGAPASELFLHCSNLDVTNVTVDGKKAKFKVRGDKLWVYPAQPIPVGEPAEVRTIYTGRPVNGFYFVNAASAFPSRTGMVYTQSEPDDTRCWLPTYDEPDDFATSEAFIEVPKRYTALSNGKLVSLETHGDLRTFHWRMDLPHATYLNSLVAGEYVEVKQKSKDTAVSFFVPPGLEREGQATFGRTPEMLSFVSKLLGKPYPFDRFSQIVVGDFVVAGMENASAVTLTIQTLHPAETEPVENSEDLIVHELTHQWIGNMVAAKDWNHLWLNEGFATFVPMFWLRSTKGQDEYDLQRYSTMVAAVNAFRTQPLTPVVSAGPKAIATSLGSPYSGGAARLSMLADMVGEKKFWHAVGAFLDQHNFQPATTDDFFRSMSKSLGRDLQPFVQQWFYSGSIPRLTISTDGDDLVIRQRKPYFKLELPVWILDDEKWVKRTVDVDGEETKFPLGDLAGAPLIVDPEYRVLSEVTTEGPLETEDVTAMYRHATSPSMKAHILDLGFTSLDKEEALDLLREERMPLLAARMIARLKPSEEAAEEIALRLKSEDKRVAFSAASALSKMPPTEEAIDGLTAAVATDPNVIVKQAALGSLIELTQSEELAEQAWQQDSFADSYRIRAMSFWARRVPEIAREKALEALSRPISEPLRAICIEALGIAKDKPGERRVYETLCRMLHLPAYRARLSAIRSLGVYGDPAAIPLIRPLGGQRYLEPAVGNTIQQLRRRGRS